MSSITKENVETAVAELRQMLLLDGADLQFVSGGDTSVTFALDLDKVDCAECVLPSKMIETMLAQQLSDSIPQITKVVVNDPRDTGAVSDSVTHH